MKEQENKMQRGRAEAALAEVPSGLAPGWDHLEFQHLAPQLDQHQDLLKFQLSQTRSA